MKTKIILLFIFVSLLLLTSGCCWVSEWYPPIHFICIVAL